VVCESERLGACSMNSGPFSGGSQAGTMTPPYNMNGIEPWLQSMAEGWLQNIRCCEPQGRIAAHTHAFITQTSQVGMPSALLENSLLLLGPLVGWSSLPSYYDPCVTRKS
jgi:hypothetical protein